MSEKIQIDYDFLVEYFNTELNVIGATTDITLRTVTAHTDLNSIYVRKFGTDYLITEVTDIEDPIDVNMTFTVKSKTTDTTLGSRVGGGAFVAGSTLATAEGCYLEISASGGIVTVLASITIDTDIDVGGLAFVCPAESVADGETLRLYLSDTSSTYYDENYMYGGARHTPDSSSRLPYFDITTAIADPDATGFTICTVLDSATYDEQFSISIASMKLQSALGQTPTITSGVGARTSREVIHDGNNTDTRYVSKTGLDTNAGTYQAPFLTIQYGENNMGGLSYLNLMDSETYDETVAVDTAVTIEPIYGKTPIMTNTLARTADSYCIYLNHVSASVYGVEFNGQSKHYCILFNIQNYAGTVKNNICHDGRIYNIYYISGSVFFQGTIESNIIYNTSAAGIRMTVATQCSGTMTGNILYNNGIGIDLSLSGAGGTTICNTGINNNIIYDHDTTNASGLRITSSGTYSGVCENNTIWNNYYGIQVQITTITGTFRDMIVYSSGLYDLHTPAGAFPTITESNYGTNSGWTIGAGNITTDPDFVKDTTPYEFGLNPTSGAYRTDTSSDDMGVHFRIIEYNESTIEVNGFNITGQSQFNSAAYIADTADHITNSLKWGTVSGFQGISIDPYDDDTNTDFTIANCNINNNGNGIKLSYGGNTIQECLIYNNSVYGIHSDYTGQIFNHNVFFQNGYGLYLKSNSALITITNCIFNSNSLYGIFSEITINTITYSNITDSINSNVDRSSTTNINVEPLFININEGVENFNIKTKETNILDANGNIIGQYDTNSGCKDVSDGILYDDIGAYGVDRGIEEQAWRKYVLENNPTNLNDDNEPKGAIQNDDALGSYSSWARAHKNIFPLEWAENQYSTDAQRKYIKYFNTLRPSRELGKTKENTRIRFKRLPLTFLQSGTNGVLSGTIFTDANKTLAPDEVKGYYLAIKYDSQVNYVIDATAKTATSSGAGWTIDEHIGRFLKYDGYSYYVKSNTATILTLSDPYSTLTNASGQSLSIEKYFEIKTNNTDTAYTLYDPDSELVDGTYDYYIDFAMTRSVVENFSSKQPLYNPDGVSTGYSLMLETI